MNKKILALLNTTAGQLVFALLSGFGYIGLMGGTIVRYSRGMWIILLFFAPVVICGAALIIIKQFKNARDNETEGAILRSFWLHVYVIILGLLFTIAELT